MPTELGWRHIQMVINGIRVTGYSDDSPPVEFPDIELLQETWGPDGTLHLLSTGRKGGEVMVKLLPTSAFVEHLLRWHADIQGDENLEFEGTYADARLNFSCLMRGGKLKICPPAVVPGETFEATFVFEELIPQADRFLVSPPPGNLPG